MKDLIRPGLFAIPSAADSRRAEFDCKNQVIVERETPVDFVFIGDSITHMWELQAYFGGNGRVVLNRGIGGDVTTNLLRRLPADVLQLKPKNCVLLVGINDAWDLEFDHSGMRQSLTVDEVYNRAASNFRQIIQLCGDSGVTLAVCSVLPVDMAWTNREEQRRQYVLRLNAALQELCDKRGVTYVDYYSKMVRPDQPIVKEGITIEGLHPNVWGYDIMADTLRATLAGRGIEI